MNFQNKLFYGFFVLVLIGAASWQISPAPQLKESPGEATGLASRTPASLSENQKSANLASRAPSVLSENIKNVFSLMESQRWADIFAYLAQGGDPHIRDENGKSLLDWAAMYGQVDLIKELVARGADVNSQDHEGKTPLMSATSQNHPEAIALLLEAGAALEIKNDIGQTALLVAVENSHEGLVNLFADKGAQLDQTFGENQFNAYLLASNNGDTSMMDKLIEVHADFVRSKDRWGRTAAHWSCADGDIRSAAAILRHGGRLDEKDSYGRTAFSYASENGSNACTAFAEEAGLKDYL